MVRPGCLVSPVTYTSGEGRPLALYDGDSTSAPARYLPPGSLALVVALRPDGLRALLLDGDMRLGWATVGQLFRWRTRG